MSKYSLLTTVNLWNQDRVDKFLRCIQSVQNINYKDFEWVVVDDGSPVEFLWDSLLKGDYKLTLIHKKHGERVLASNEAFKVATGDWWSFLDSDDELDPEIFNILDKHIQQMHKLYNFGSIHIWPDGTETKKPPFSPEWLGRKHGHAQFGSGGIVNGTFVFHKSIYEKLGGYGKNVDEEGWIRNIDCTVLNYPGFNDQPKPYIRDLNMGTPFDFSAAAQLEFPELQRFYMEKHEDHPEKLVKELGNPWGQDFYLFYKYTRKYKSFLIDEYLYTVHHRP